MNMLSIFLTYFSLLVVLITVLYFAGAFIFKVFKINVQNIYVSVFSKILTAVTLLTVISAIYFTKGFTVMAILLPILFILYRLHLNTKSGNQMDADSFPDIGILISLLIGIVLIFIFRFYVIYNPSGSLPMAPHADVVFYSSLSDFLLKFGNENSSLDYIYPAGCSPYHYFELWLTAFLKSITGLNSGLILVLIVYSFGPVLIWLGFCAVLSHFKKKQTIIDNLFCLFSIFLTGIFFKFYTHVDFMQNIGVFACNAMNYNKLFPIYIYAIAALLFSLNKKNTEAILCLLIIPVIFISTSIGLFVALFVWIIIDFLRVKKLNKVSLFSTFFIAFCIYLFYKISPEIHTHVSADFSDSIYKMTDFAFLKTCFNIITGTVLQFILLFIPVLIFYVINSKIKISDLLSNSIIYFVALVYIISLFGWAFLHESNTTVQVFTNISVVLFHLLSFYVLMIIWCGQNRSKWYNILFLFLFFMNGFLKSTTNNGVKLSYPQSDAYLEEIINISNDLSLCGTFIYSSEDYKATQFGFVSNFHKPGNYLIYSKKTTFPLSISPYSFILSEDKVLADMQQKSLVNTPFWKYVEEQKAKGIFKSIEISQIEFIDEFNINYLICTKTAILSEQLKQKIKREIVDENTGERFCLLK